MAAIQMISFTDIGLNGQLNGSELDGNVKKCSVYKKEGRWVHQILQQWVTHYLNSQVLSSR